jgi:hypothetical protein
MIQSILCLCPDDPGSVGKAARTLSVPFISGIVKRATLPPIPPHVVVVDTGDSPLLPETGPILAGITRTKK